jgi:hypothetical protein
LTKLHGATKMHHFWLVVDRWAYSDIPCDADWAPFCLHCACSFSRVLIHIIWMKWPAAAWTCLTLPGHPQHFFRYIRSTGQ